VKKNVKAAAKGSDKMHLSDTSVRCKFVSLTVNYHNELANGYEFIMVLVCDLGNQYCSKMLLVGSI